MATSVRSLVVATGGTHHQTLPQAQALLANILKRGGCGGCLSGLDIHFVNETQIFTHNVTVTPQQVEG
jgi:hypothetical protein